MNGDGEKRRAAAKCTNCGEIGIVRLWPDGRIEPVGNVPICSCGDSDLRVLENDEDGVPEPT